MNTPDSNLINISLIVITVFIILFVGLNIFNTLVMTTDTTGEIQTAAVGTDSNEWTTLEGEYGRSETIVTSRGYAVNLTGGDTSYVKSSEDIRLPSENWTVSTWTYLDTNATDQTVLSVNGRVVIHYNTSQTEWRAWYYSDSSTNSYELAVDAPNQPSTWTHLTVSHNGTHLNFYRDNIATANVSVNQSSTIDAPINASNLNGRLEETRLFSSVLNSSQRQQLLDTPIAPLTNADRTARIMYDEPYKDNQLILFSTATLMTNDVTYSSGFAGDTLENGLLSDEYKWQDIGPKIKIPTDSAYANYPVVYATYNYNTMVGSFMDSAVDALLLVPLALMILIFGFVVTVLRETTQR